MRCSLNKCFDRFRNALGPLNHPGVKVPMQGAPNPATQQKRKSHMVPATSNFLGHVVRSTQSPRERDHTFSIENPERWQTTYKYFAAEYYARKARRLARKRRLKRRTYLPFRAAVDAYNQALPPAAVGHG